MSALELEVETFTEDSPRLCACGCGMPLKEGAKRTYIHGHKLAMERGEDVPDPEPSDEAVQRSTIRVTAKIKREMEESVKDYLIMAAGVWEMSDPVCGEVATARAEKIAEKLVPVLCRNQSAVRFFARSGSFHDGMDLMMAVWPVIKIAGQHHLFHTVGQTQRAEAPQFPLNGFVAP